MSPETVGLVKARLKDAAQKSWELGTRAQALLELDSPSISVFTAASIPGSPAASHSGSLDALVPVANAVKIALADGQLKDIMKITTDIVSSKPDGSLPLMKDGSATDPASNGVAVLVANWTESQGPDFAAAASDQITWLLQHVPRSSKGAISHRNNVMQFWSDFIYMVPPFLAYYGASTSNKTLIAESYRQIKLYREALLDDSGLWQHIRQGSFEDKGLWSTGNGWAAMGMMRVAATIKAGGYMDEFKDEFNDLADWTGGIFDAMWPLLTEDNLFYNYANNPKTFLDGASSALMAASVYRAAVLFNNTAHISSAEKVYNAIGGADALLPTSSSAIVSPTFTSTDSESPTSTPNKRRSHSRRATHHRVPLGVAHHSNDKSHHKRATKHIDSQGWLTPVVDPHSFHQIGQESAEGQAFVIMMYAARNDYLSKKGLQLHVGTGSVGPVANVVGVGIVAGSPGTAGSSGGGLNGPINVGGAGPNNNATSSGTTKNNGAGTVRVATGALVGMAGLLLALLI